MKSSDRTSMVLPRGEPRPTKSGAQPGNMHAVKHPWNAYWKRRALRPEERWVLTLVRDYVPELIADKGGDVSAAERKVMELAAVARVCWALAMPAGNLRAVARFLGVEQACLSDLGLGRRARDVNPLDAVREAVARANEEER